MRAPGTTLAEVSRTMVDEFLLPGVQYACLYGIQHLLRAKLEAGDQEHVRQVLEVHFLHWIEALAWIQKISEAISSVTALEAITQVDSFLQISNRFYDKRMCLTNHYDRKWTSHRNF